MVLDMMCTSNIMPHAPTPLPAQHVQYISVVILYFITLHFNV